MTAEYGCRWVPWLVLALLLGCSLLSPTKTMVNFREFSMNADAATLEDPRTTAKAATDVSPPSRDDNPSESAGVVEDPSHRAIGAEAEASSDAAPLAAGPMNERNVPGTTLPDATAEPPLPVASSERDDDAVPEHAYSTAAANYTWTNTASWSPPTGMDSLTPRDVRGRFVRENVLWLGDSTGRQDYHTMHTLMNDPSVPADEPLVLLGNGRRYGSLLDTGINKGKKGNPVEAYSLHCPARCLPSPDSKEHLHLPLKVVDLGQVAGTDANCNTIEPSDRGNQTASPFAMSEDPTVAGKFDYATSKTFKETQSYIINHGEFMKREYSVLVMSVGVWDIANPKSLSVTLAEMSELLELLHDLSGPSLLVIWKVHGHTDKMFGRRLEPNRLRRSEGYQETARRWFDEHRPAHMDLEDFGMAVGPRSSGRRRIQGDLDPHWRTPARLLSIEMVSNILHRHQIRACASCPQPGNASIWSEGLEQRANHGNITVCRELSFEKPKKTKPYLN